MFLKINCHNKYSFEQKEPQKSCHNVNPSVLLFNLAFQNKIKQKNGVKCKAVRIQNSLNSTSQKLTEYSLDKFHRSNQDTSLVHKPSVYEGQWVQSGDLLADCSASVGGELSLGQNILIAYMPWEGYNFEDAILISERLVSDDLYTSIHIERYEIERRSTKLGMEEITREIPETSEECLKHLNPSGIAKLGSWIREGDILVGKVTPINKKNQSNYQKLLSTILEKPVVPFRDTSLRAPKGIKAKIVGFQFFKNPQKKILNESLTNSKQQKEHLTSKNKQNSQNNIIVNKTKIKNGLNLKTVKSPNISKNWNSFFDLSFFYTAKNLIFYKNKNQIKSFSFNNEKKAGILLENFSQKKLISSNSTSVTFPPFDKMETSSTAVSPRDRSMGKSYRDGKSTNNGSSKKLDSRFSETQFNFNKELNDNKTTLKLKKASANPLNQISSIQIYLAEKRRIQVGDKMAGRHGNKGIISQILPREDMPFLPDGTPLDMILNPLGVPSRMNVGQIYECLLGLAGKHLGENFKIFPFDETYGAEASRSFVYSKLYEAKIKTHKNWLFNPNSPGKMRLYDGRSGEMYHQPVTVGYAYIIRLVHMVDDKIHARSTGPYSLVTQQPLRGRSKQGGQRLGEMEVWALEGYGAAFTLLEMLTIKSDDMTGRMTLWSNLILNKEISIGTPESFKVLICELQALCLDIGLFRNNSKNDSSF